jgi:hypothetical protein
MRLGRLIGGAVILVPLLLVCAARLNAQRHGTPQGMTQEVNRCLTVMRAFSARRRTAEADRQRERMHNAVRSDCGMVYVSQQAESKTA